MPVPYYSQFDERHVERAGPAACYRACRAMAAAVGVVIPASTEKRYQVAALEDGTGGVASVDVGVLTVALEHLHSELEAGRPVVMGTTYKPGGPNRDGMTDHWVLVVGFNERTQNYHVLDPGLAAPTSGQHWNALWARSFTLGILVRQYPVKPAQQMTSIVPREGVL